MPRLEEGTNNTTKIGLIVLAVLLALGVAWYAMSGGNNAADNNATTPPAASSEAGSPPPPPPSDNTAVLQDNTDNTANAAGMDSGSDAVPTPDAMGSDAMNSATLGGTDNTAGGADMMATPSAAGSNGVDGAAGASGAAGVTMTPSGKPMASDANSFERSKTIKQGDTSVTYTKKFKDSQSQPVKP